MKKLIAIALSLIMLCCAVMANAESLTFYLDTLSAEGMENVKVADLGMSMTITLNDDGTAVVNQDGEDESLTWTQPDESTIVIGEGDDALTFALDTANMTLTFNEEGYVMVFTTTPSEVTNFGEAIEAAGVSAFDGSWTCTHMVAEGMTINTDSLDDETWATTFGASREITIADGAVTLFGAELGSFTFVGGKLVLGDDSGIAQTLSLTDTGYLCYSIADSIYLYCAPIAK